MTYPRYRIEHIGDLLDVPKERRGVLLHELVNHCADIENMRAMLSAIGMETGRSRDFFPGFDWIDDGKHDDEIRLTVK